MMTLIKLNVWMRTMSHIDIFLIRIKLTLEEKNDIRCYKIIWKKFRPFGIRYFKMMLIDAFLTLIKIPWA